MPVSYLSVETGRSTNRANVPVLSVECSYILYFPIVEIISSYLPGTEFQEVERLYLKKRLH